MRATLPRRILPITFQQYAPQAYAYPLVIVFEYIPEAMSKVVKPAAKRAIELSNDPTIDKSDSPLVRGVNSTILPQTLAWLFARGKRKRPRNE